MSKFWTLRLRVIVINDSPQTWFFVCDDFQRSHVISDRQIFSYTRWMFLILIECLGFLTYGPNFIRLPQWIRKLKKLLRWFFRISIWLAVQDFSYIYGHIKSIKIQSFHRFSQPVELIEAIWESSQTWYFEIHMCVKK